MRLPVVAVTAALALLGLEYTDGFTPSPHRRRYRRPRPTSTRVAAPEPPRPRHRRAPGPAAPPSPTALRLLLDVPDHFFLVAFVGAGLLKDFSKNLARVRMEERAWEQRLAEGRALRLRRDPTATELDLRRREAALEWSAYGNRNDDREAGPARQRAAEEAQPERRRGGRRVRVMEREEVLEDEVEDLDANRDYRMTDEEIKEFELEYGVDYDPYYDDPYTEDELPEGKFRTDKRYGDRIYNDGEIFYRDAKSGLFYRQGAKPRHISIWSRS